MLCHNCGKRPAQKFIRNVDGKSVTVELCPACYRALYTEKPWTGFASLMGEETQNDAVCPVCGTTFGEFRRTGLLGCAGCYSAFREQLFLTVRGIQANLRHAGKRPESHTEEDYDRVRAYVSRQETLREQIEEAMRRHDYAAARRLQQALRDLSSRKEELR